MTGPQIETAAVIVLIAAVVALLSLRSARRARADAAAARAEAEQIRTRLSALDERLERLDRVDRADRGSRPGREGAGLGPDDERYTITGIGADERGGAEAEGAPAAGLQGRLFTDLVVRESIVKAAALSYGVRRALSPAHRNRMRFEMRQEVLAARKQRRATRKAELRAARRLIREAEARDEDAA